MRQTMLGAAAFLAAAMLPAAACDPEEMNAYLTQLCRAALDPAIGWVQAAQGGARGAEAAQIDLAIARATEACDSGDPNQGVREAVRLARLAGRLEARAGGE